MSVNITVNSKFGKHRSHALLADPQQLKKSEEKERRKLRLLEVREECKKLAKKIRDEVNEEKKSELEKLQATKEKELECWRQNALQRKEQDFRSALFQVGTAHKAAQLENENEAKRKEKPGSYKDFKKQMVTKKCEPGKVKFSCQPYCPCQQIVTGANKHFKCTCTQTQNYTIQSKSEEAKKRKRRYSLSSSESECEDEGYKEQTTLNHSSYSLSSTCDTTSSLSINNPTTPPSMFLPTKNNCLIRTPAVHLDVQVGTDDSVTISAPAEVTDTHAQYGRQFSSVIRISPRKGKQQRDNTSENVSMAQSSTTTSLSNKLKAKEQNINKSSLDKSQNKHIEKPTPKMKRFTIISELVKKQQENATSAPDNGPFKSYPRASRVSTTTPHLSPKKQSKGQSIQAPIVEPAVHSPRKSSATSKSSRAGTTLPLTSSTTLAKTNSLVISNNSNSGRVQFYDYNSKLGKEGDQASTTIGVQRQTNQSQPTAMHQAAIENQKERERQLEELKKCQIMQERGQKALEREQIRRDCNELTEKLEVLSREYANQLPLNENKMHIVADKQLRKEGKMNSAIEKLLQRPSVITCSEQNKQIIDDGKLKTSTSERNLLNVASLNDKPLPADDVSSDSCCSILLGYVDDQSRLVKQDLKTSATTKNQSKHNRLQNLLKRLDQLRKSLVDEIENENDIISSKEENFKQMIDNLTEMRKEREQIMVHESKPKLLRDREKELEAKEALLEQKVREFYELQKTQTITHKTRNEEKQNEVYSSSVETKNTENMVSVAAENPLEIIITVKGETKSIKIPQKTKRKMTLKKSPCKVSTLIRSPQPSLTKSKKHTSIKKKVQATKLMQAQSMLRTQNSYDSNSTSYMSLPPELPTKLDDLALHITKEQHEDKHEEQQTLKQITKDHSEQKKSENSVESLNNSSTYNPPPRVNPLIAQYVQRLLGMSRNAVQNLGVSSSEIESPGSSIINTTGNVTNNDITISDERLKTLQNFIEENKSFIKDIEESIRSQNNESLENSMRMLDDIWRQRFRTKPKEVSKKKQQCVKLIDDSNKIKEKHSLNKQIAQHINNHKSPQVNKTVDSKSMQREPKSFKQISKSLSSHYSSDGKDSTTSLKTSKHSVQSADKGSNYKLAADSSKTESNSEIARYAKLTENCTQRIAELTELINRVREEKQRLLEVTLSSVSDNGRHSTEYLELPESKRSSTHNEQDDITRMSSSSEETTRNRHSVNSTTLAQMPKLSSADKNKQIANSRDSGIAESRPITALDNRHDIEQPSQTSSESTVLQAVRKMKPPPTLKRFSPQLPEEELAHELSTILEVDTPATSRIHTAVGQVAEETKNICNTEGHQALKFPTFEEYIKQLELDITQLDNEQSIQLQQEFTTFRESLQQNRLSADSPKYIDFPSLNAYLQKLAESDLHIVETIDESLAKLHISGIQPHNFPTVREYIKANTSKSLPSDEQQLLDTKSLENITEAQAHANSDNDTASIDIQEEMKKRNIIKNSFRFTKRKKEQIFSSTAKKDEAFFQNILQAESGLDKLSTSATTSDSLDNDIKRMVEQWPREMRKESKDVKILSSTTTSTNLSALANSALRAASLDESQKESGRVFNLRNFLTRELEKLANHSTSTSNSSTDESLRSHFLNSLIDSLTPRTPGFTSKSQTLDRQKTSTPVPGQSSKIRSLASNHSNSSSQLFSGESLISSVHYQERSVRFVNSDDANADQSSN